MNAAAVFTICSCIDSLFYFDNTFYDKSFYCVLDCLTSCVCLVICCVWFADEPVGEVIEAASEADSDDARWNGEVNPDVTDPEELDEDELDNDYCQNYFDNGEADISDDNLGGDDDDGNTRYYDWLGIVSSLKRSIFLHPFQLKMLYISNKANCVNSFGSFLSNYLLACLNTLLNGARFDFQMVWGDQFIT